MSTYNVTVILANDRRKFFRSELNAESRSVAIVDAARQLKEAYAGNDALPKSPKPELIIVICERDFNTNPQAWSLNLNNDVCLPCSVPCGECLGHGAVDSGGFDPQGHSIEIPCSSCSSSQQGQEHVSETVLRAWQEAFGTSQLDHAIARLERAEKLANRLGEWERLFKGSDPAVAHLDYSDRANKANEALHRFKTDVWASLDKYSKTLGWGIGGHQEEAWTCLDAAVNELACRRIVADEIRAILGCKAGDDLPSAVRLLKTMYDASQPPKRG